MNKEQIPPFYVGQEVEAVRDHHQGAFRKGDRFNVTRIEVSSCKCTSWYVSVGIPGKPQRGKCICGVIRTNDHDWRFGYTSFRAITPQFQAISFEKVLEENPVSVS